MKILLLDIESAPNVAYVWGLFKENIPLARIIDSGYILCWAAKWYGEDEIMFDSIHQSKPKAMLKRIHALLEEADAVIHYNGTRFDIPTLNKEFLLNNIKPPAPFKEIDLLKTARSRFRFTSNKLDYVAQALGVGQKHNTSFDLWVDCMAGDETAWAKMEEYNKQDVIILEGVYEEFKPWIRGHANHSIYQGRVCCPSCASTRYQKRGFAATTSRFYQRYKCTECGTWFRSTSSIPGTSAPVVTGN